MPTRQYLARLITVRYLIALAFIALIVTLSIIVTGMTITVEREGYHIVALASEQRLASQRIPFLANAYVNASDEQTREIYRNALRKAVANMEERHKILSLGVRSMSMPQGIRSILRDVYLTGPQPLKLQVDRFLDSANAVLAAKDLHHEAPELVRLNIAGGGYLLDTHGLLVRLLRNEESAALDRIYGLDKALWVLILIMLAAEVPMIFQPMTRRASQTLEEMHVARVQAEHAATAARAARDAQASFIRTMSHELRTPLNAILGMNQLMRMKGLHGKQGEYAQDIDRAGRHLLGLIDDVLEFGRLEAKQVEIRKAAISLRGELERTHALLQPLAARKDLALKFELDPALASFYRADGLRIRQVLINIAGNAIKFTDQGSVTLRAVLAGAGDSNVDVVRFEVEDTGIGVPPGARDRIFQEFQQADYSLARKYGGSGLGLAISRRLVELMGGEIGMDSGNSKGSLFWFTLSLERVSAADARAGGTILAPTDPLSVPSLPPEPAAGGGLI